MKSIAVIGGGITGITTAYALAKRGFVVTVFEKHRYAAMDTSFATGAQISASNAEVWTHWSTVIQALRGMLRNDAPIMLNPTPSWHKLSWFAEFISNIRHYRRNTVDIARLAVAAREHLFSWAQAEGLDFDLQKKGMLHIYRDKARFDHASEVSQLLAKGGLSRRAVTLEEMRAIEPALTGQYYGGYYTKSDSVGDIHKFTNGLAAAITRMGVTCLYEQNVAAVHTDGNTVHITIQRGDTAITSQFDGIVICAGVQSRQLAAQLGDRVNIYPVKGYSITINLCDTQSQRAAPIVSLLDEEHRLLCGRLGLNRLRVAGTVEFNGYNKDICPVRLRPMLQWAQECFPSVSTQDFMPWTGLRPMMPNMMPRVGQGRAYNVFYNTGHGHLGWTLCAVTADMVAQVVSANYQSKRFAAKRQAYFAK